MGFGAQKDATIVLNAEPSNIILSMPENDDGNNKRGGSMLFKSGRTTLIRSESTRRGISNARQRSFPRLIFTLSLFGILMTGWAVIFHWIRDAEFLCQTIYVQFTDDATPDLAPFSGLYEVGCSDQVSGCRRVKYGESPDLMIEEGDDHTLNVHGNFSDTAKFAYCVQRQSWGFVFGNETGDVLAGKTSPCNWKAHSKDVTPKTQDSYDIMSTAMDPWKVLNSRQIDIPFEGFELRCFDCKHIPSFCGAPDRGECTKNNRCKCKDGWYGRRCEFNTPCELIEFADPERDIFDGRKFATQYKRMYNDMGHPVEIYNRPVYEGIINVGGEIESTNQVFYNGLRWVLTTDLGDLLKSEKFHGYWSAKWNQYTVDFYSAAVRVDTPQDSTSPDGLVWYRPKPKQRNRSVQGVDLTSEAPFEFLCATCNDETNPCLYNGVCEPQNKTCECTSGASGRLCQILPTGNGRCDPYFNTREYAWDGGDCCESTCVSTDEYTCGRDIVLDSQGEESVGFVGFDHCKDPSVARSISGSRTIYDIKQRGVLHCGTIFTTAWFYKFMADQCRAVAASVLGNPDAIQLFNFTNDRFIGLRDGRFDIVFWTDYTANRDVYETSARSGFNYATIPYYFGGFVFAGIKPFGKCADEGDFFSAQCSDLKICLVGGTTWYDTAVKVFPSQTIVTYKDFEATVVGLQNNECNVIGGSQVDVELISIRPFGFTGEASNYEVGSKLYFKSFETWITNTDDRVWSRFTSWIFESLVQAEESNITQATSALMGTTDLFGDEFRNMFKRAVAAVGNYGEMWDRNLPFTRSGMNLVNDGSSGALISFDFGRVSDVGPEPSRTSVIRTIIARDYLRCGVTGGALGFADYNADTNTWSGIDIDICRGLAAALFDGDDSKMTVSQVTTINRFAKIQSGAVDIVPGATRTLEREIKIGVNNDAFDFSPVYFHDGMIFAGEMPFAICAESQDFTSGNCTETKICVPTGSTWYDAVVNKLGIEEKNLRLTDNFMDSMELHLSGSCNVIVGEHGRLNRLSLQDFGYVMTEDYYVGTRRFTKEPICLMHRSDDQQFSDLIKWVVFGLFYAEENDITSVNYFNMPETNLFGPDLTRIWQHSIRRVGNYAQIYGRHLGDIFPRAGMNMLNDLSSPQLFAAPGTV